MLEEVEPKVWPEQRRGVVGKKWIDHGLVDQHIVDGLLDHESPVACLTLSPTEKRGLGMYIAVTTREVADSNPHTDADIPR